MVRIVGIGGSLRRQSYNGGLLRAATALMPAGSSLDLVSIREIPLYDGDVETGVGIPAPAAMLKDRIAAADGMLIATPEYNNGIPGYLKNAIDWASRPPQDIGRVFGGKRVALIGASPGPFGTILSQAAWLPVLRTLGAEHWSGGRFLALHAADKFQDGELVDADTRERLRTFLAGFVSFIQAGTADTTAA